MDHNKCNKYQLSIKLFSEKVIITAKKKTRKNLRWCIGQGDADLKILGTLTWRKRMASTQIRLGKSVHWKIVRPVKTKKDKLDHTVMAF